MAISSSRSNSTGGKVLTNSEITSLVDAGITSTRLKQGIVEGKTYNQLLSSISFTTTSYMTTYSANLQQAIIALTGQTIQEYASSQGFTIESFQGSTYLKKEFLSSASYAPPTLLSGLNAIILLVAGGGGGGIGAGTNIQGGGGAGGLVYRTNFAISQQISIVIGGGGAAGSSGVNSTMDTLIALGGGRGGGENTSNGAGYSGGSGGGNSYSPGASSRWTISEAAATQPNSVTGGYGNSGGRGDAQTGYHSGGGGGGAGGAGQYGDNGTPRGGNGGIGLSFFGTYYAGGGGGGSWTSSGTSTGGLGGGGNGSGTNAPTQSTDGQTNTGGGGGGGQVNIYSKSGGSGYAAIRYNLGMML
jgi:hypothetical protein